MSYFCINATMTNLFWMHCKYNQSLSMCGQCIICSEYQRGDIAPRYPVPAIRCDVVIWCEDEQRTKPHGLCIIEDTGTYIDTMTYNHGKCFGYGVALATL